METQTEKKRLDLAIAAIDVAVENADSDSELCAELIDAKCLLLAADRRGLFDDEKRIIDLTEDQKHKFSGAIQGVWNDIAGDIYAASEQNSDGNVSHADAVEMVFDAGRLEYSEGADGKECLEWFKKHDYKDWPNLAAQILGCNLA